MKQWIADAKVAAQSLEKRSALGFLGLSASASSEDVSRTYKKRALELHPDKGGTEEDFHLLQEMVDRLADTKDETEGQTRGKNLFQKIKEECEKKKGAKADEEELPAHLKLHQQRAQLHEQIVRLWHRIEEAEKHILKSSSRQPNPKPVMLLLSQYVDNFVMIEINTLPLNDVVAAERTIFKF